MNKILRRIIQVVALPVVALFGLVGTAFAQNELLFGQNHFYTVVFRGNGEAITYAKLVIPNPNETRLTEFSFEVPKASPSEMVMYQIKLPQECADYNYNIPSRPCVQYRDPDYAQQYYYYGGSDGKTEYKKIQYTKSGNLYKFTLPNPVESYKTTAIVVAYAGKGYVDESLGLYKFNFETLKVPSRIQEIRVAVDVDSDLLLKGKKSAVNYGEMSTQSAGLGAPSAISDRGLDNIVGKIGSYSPLMKEAKNLAPNESFIVKGEYAKSWFRLYLGSILCTVLIIAGILAGVYFLARFLKRRSNRNDQTGSGTGEQVVSRNPLNSFTLLNLTNLSIGLFSVVGVTGLTYLLIFFADSSLFRSFNPDPAFAIIIVITTILMYILVLVGPAVLMAVRHGWKSLLSILVAEFFWFVVFLIIYFILFQSGLTQIFYGGGPALY